MPRHSHHEPSQSAASQAHPQGMVSREEEMLESVRHPMPSLVNANMVIDELYGNNPNQKIPLKTILEAEAKASVAPDVLTYFRHIPDKEYTKQELIEALNALVKARHREHAVGLFGVGYAEELAQRKLQQMRAASP